MPYLPWTPGWRQGIEIPPPRAESCLDKLPVVSDQQNNVERVLPAVMRISTLHNLRVG